jgi:hypothetical protein
MPRTVAVLLLPRGKFVVEFQSQDGKLDDPIGDTPTCASTDDCSAEFDSSFMTPGTGAQRKILTAGQGLVMRNSSVVCPHRLVRAAV